jgi:hypothetical protein
MITKSWLRSLLPALLLILPGLSLAQASVNVSVNLAPPELPVYDQPPIPGDGYIWTPGYWAWSDDDQDYFWVPGTWVEAPQPDYLWTPGYWGAEGAVFIWNAGYWGPHVGFYGGVNYGFGYGGHGYEGGYWQGGHMFYNRAVVNVGSTHITNVYNKTVINNVTVNRVSFNGGNGGVRAEATASEQAAARDRHIQVTSSQQAHEQTARSNPSLRAKSNHGNPPVAATPRPGSFSGAGVVAPRGAPNAGARPNNAARPSNEGRPNNGESRAVPAPQPRETPAQRPQPAQRPEPTQRPEPVEQHRPPVQTPEQPRTVQPRPESHEAPKSEPKAEAHPAPRPEHPPEH